MRITSINIAAIIFLSTFSVAYGQVFRCEVGGKSVYSDAPCKEGQKGNLIQEKRTSEEIYQDRLRALEADRVNQERIYRQRERELYERSRQLNDQERSNPVVIHNQYQNIPPPPETWEQRNERRNRETSERSIMRDGGRWDEKAARERKAERDRNTLDCDVWGGTATCRPRR